MSLNLNTIRQFFLQEKNRGTVDDKILNELQVDLVMAFESIKKTQYEFRRFLEVKFGNPRGQEMSSPEGVPYDDTWFTKWKNWAKRTGADPLGYSWTFTPRRADYTLNKLHNAKSDKEKILAINHALNVAHESGYMLQTFDTRYNDLREKLGLKQIKSILKEILNSRGDFKKIKSVFDTEYNDQDPAFELDDQDLENIRQTDKITTDQAKDMSRIPHPEQFQEIEGKGMFFIGGDAVNIDMQGDQSPFGIDYPNYFKGWAVGKDRLQIFEKKAQQGYYYVGVILYSNPTSSSFQNPAFLKALDRKCQEIAQGLEVDYRRIKNEVHSSEFKTRQKKEATLDMFGYLGEQVPENIIFFKGVLNLLKQEETKQIKERGGSPKNDQTVFVSKVLEEVAEESSSRKHKGSYGKIVGVGKFAEGLRGEDRVIKHEVYPEEIIFSNYVELPQPIEVSELVPAIKDMHPNVDKQYLLSTIYTRVQGYNLTVDRSVPLVQELMDLADRADTNKSPMTWEGLKKSARLKKTANLEVSSRDGDKIRLELETLKDKKQRETFVRNYMNNAFEIDNVWHHQLDPIEQMKVRTHYNNLKYL